MSPAVFEQKHMGTRVTVTAHPVSPERDLAAAADAVFAVFVDLEQVFSLFRSDSEISRVNARAGEATKVSPRFLEALRYALALADETGGVFDPLVGALTAPRRDPAAHRCRYQDVAVDPAAGVIRLPPGAVLDLNAVVKGLALDLALTAFGGTEALMIEAGGDIVVRGLPPGKPAWNIGIRDPRRPELVAAVLPVRSGAVCTSGDYFRGKEARDAGRAHLVDARDGRPAGDIASLTVLAPTAKAADALSTAAWLLPSREAPAFVERHDGAACLLIDAAGQIFAGARLRAMLYDQVHA